MRTDQKLFCLKTVLTIFLSLLWLIGAAIFGVSLWLRLDFWTNEYMGMDPSLERYLILIYITVAAGGVVVLFSLLGLLGGCCKKKWLLVIYLIAILSAMVLTISAFVYGIIYREELKDTLVRGDFLQNGIQTKYLEDRSNRFTRVVDIMQSELECCGANGPTDYFDSNWDKLTNKHNQRTIVPASCCKTYQRDNDRTATCLIYLSDTDKQFSLDIWTSGCRKPLQQFLDRYIVVVIIIVSIFFLLQLICMIVTSILIHVLNSLYVPQPDDIVYDMAHNQEKSPYPSRGDYRDYYH